MAIVRLSYTPAEAGATVTQVRLYTDPARTGVPVFTGVPVNTGGVWTFAPDLSDGDYYSAFDVTDSTGTFTDADDFFYVQFGGVVPGSQVVSLARVRTQLGLTDKRHDDELVDLIASAVRTVGEWCGTILPVTETIAAPRGATTVILPNPLISATVTRNGVPLVSGTDFTVNLAGGFLEGYGLGGSTITYTAGRSPVPANIRRALLRWISWSWRRDHGGSESYLPGGDDASPGLGVAGIEREIRHILGPDARGMRVA